MHNSLKIIKSLLYSYSALHVSDTLAPIIRSLLILHIQLPVTVCRWVICIFQLWSVITVAIATVVDTVVCAPDDGWKYHPKHVEQFPDMNKLCNVASCWTYIGILLGAHYVVHISRIRVNILVNL
jgi:hypothetical protein